MLLVNAIFIVACGYFLFEDLREGNKVSACVSGALVLVNAAAIVLR